MLFVPESEVGRHASLADAWAATRQVFMDMATADAVNYPVVRESVPYSGAVFGVKSAQYRRHGVLGLKAGGYFPSNAPRGDTNHQSFVMLFDDESGKPRGIVGGNLLTQLRTAAASAVSIDLLARRDARTLGVLGAGAQAARQIEAALLARPFERILLWNRTPERARALARGWRGDVPIEPVDTAQDAVCDSDVVITITNAAAPLVKREWVPDGCHLACMGADTAGKQEVDSSILRAARVFTDDLAQAGSIGECQHALRDGGLSATDIHLLGHVLTGKVPGRQHERQVTVFDGTGVAAQDIAMAVVVSDRASRERSGR